MSHDMIIGVGIGVILTLLVLYTTLRFINSSNTEDNEGD